MTLKQHIANHVHGIGSSGIRRVFDLGASLKNPINLSIGEPDFEVPQPIRQAMIRAIEERHTSYTVTRGIQSLRDRIARQLKEEFNWSPDLFVTSGLSGGLFLALLATINAGDEVVFADPYFVSYAHLVRLVHGVPKMVDTYPDFQLHPDRFAEAITSKTKIVLLCSPANPTGTTHREENVRAVCELARKHNLLIISDEIYNMLVFDGAAPSPVSFAPERTILLRGYGKSYAMTGLRMGYAAGPSEIIGEMAKLQQYTYVCAPHPAQYGALTAMDVDMSAQVAAYRAKRDLVCAELEGAFEFTRPTGGFYVFPKAPGHFPSATAFVEEAIKRNVLIIPGEVFSQRDTHFRISYAAPDEKIKQGCAILRDLAMR
jgi:aspartate/methionine/tyrosine aminotransferase